MSRILKSVDLESPVKFDAPAFIERAWTEKAKDGSTVRKVEMLASGIKIDAYHDRMSENAVKEMSVGMIGKDFLPDHHAEWHEVLGEITDGRVDDKFQYWATVTLDPAENQNARELADSLFKAVQAGKKIGVSIAGWIKRVMFEEDDTGKEVRVIDSIASDHIAATRTPAYADAHISGIKRSAIEKMFLPYLARSLDTVEKDVGLQGAWVEDAEEPVVQDGGMQEIGDIIRIDRDAPPELWHFPIGLANAQAVKKAVSPKHYTLADEGTPWSFDAKDGNKLIERGGWALFKAAHAWYDDDEGDTPEVKFAYKLPHHKEVDGQVKTVWKGVASAMSVLFGARGGADIPDAERKATYEHLAYHYKEFGRGDSIPEFSSIEPTLHKWLEYASSHQLSNEEIEANMDVMLSGAVPDCLKDEEIAMDPKELAELLAKNNEALIEGVGQTVAPLNEAMTLMSQGMAAILKAQEKPVEKKAEPEKVDPMAAVLAEVEALKARVAEYESEPQRKGEVADPTVKEAEDGEHYTHKIHRVFESEAFQEELRKNPDGALKYYLSFYEDSAGANHLFKEYRDAGIVANGIRNSGWTAVA